MKDLVGQPVFCKRNNTTGTVVAQDSVTITVETAGVQKQVTMATFNRWYNEVPTEGAAEQTPAATPSTQQVPAEPVTPVTPPASSRRGKSTPPLAAPAQQPAAPVQTNTDGKKQKKKDKETNKEAAVAGGPSLGQQLRDKFVALIKEISEGKNIDISVNDKTKADIIKYNGKNVFECNTAKKRFNVLCHPDSLTPDNTKRAEKIFPKEWGWSLRAKFVFTDIAQWPLMKSVITDGLFYREAPKE
jgi:hypothetical protein